LNWSLPSDFSLASGSLNRSLGVLPIGGSGSNSITVDVASDASDANASVVANASSSNSDSSSDSKIVTIGSPVSITETVVVPGGSTGGTGLGGSSGGGIVYDKVVEIVRGEEDFFAVEIVNKYVNSTLKDLEIEITGYFSQYVSTSPLKIDEIKYGDNDSFLVSLNIPAYIEEQERYSLVARIKGVVSPDRGIDRRYSEVQNILLVIQEVEISESLDSLNLARDAIEEMKEFGFNVDEAERLYAEAVLKLENKENKEALILAERILEIRDLAFEADILIGRVLGALGDIVNTEWIMGIIDEAVYDDEGNRLGVDSFISGQAVFGGSEVEDLLNLALAAFNRGDYELAYERAESARVLLLLERKGNIWLFFYLYWKYVLAGVVLFSIVGYLMYKSYLRGAVARKIRDMNNEEVNLRGLFSETQGAYFSGKISSGEYHRAMDQHQTRLANLQKSRLKLRNRRIKMTAPRNVLSELGTEVSHAEDEIKKLQTDFYVDKKISKDDYDLQFKVLNERLVEIEGERTAIGLMNVGKKVKKVKVKKISRRKSRGFAKRIKRKIKLSRSGSKGEISRKLKKKKLLAGKSVRMKGSRIVKKVKDAKYKVKNRLKFKRNGRRHGIGKKGAVDLDVSELVKRKDFNGKWVKINVKEKKK
jgi:hypothetical protein